METEVKLFTLSIQIGLSCEQCELCEAVKQTRLWWSRLLFGADGGGCGSSLKVFSSTIIQHLLGPLIQSSSMRSNVVGAGGPRPRQGYCGVRGQSGYACREAISFYRYNEQQFFWLSFTYIKDKQWEVLLPDQKQTLPLLIISCQLI